jgi:hypothetical protein
VSAFAQALRHGNKFARLSITLMIAFAVALSGVGMKLYLAKAQGVPRVTSIAREDDKPLNPPSDMRRNWGKNDEASLKVIIRGENLENVSSVALVMTWGNWTITGKVDSASSSEVRATFNLLEKVPGTYNLKVTDSSGQEAFLPNAFLVVSDKPKITSVERYDGKPGPPPTETRLNWGSTTEGIVRFVIKGSNLFPGAEVYINTDGSVSTSTVRAISVQSYDDDQDGINEDPPEDEDGDGLYNEDPRDGVDNDYDGLIDEDGPGIDNDGDGSVDEDPIEGGGKAYWVDNDGDQQTKKTDEDPIDGIDNDGDGKIDEDPAGISLIVELPLMSVRAGWYYVVVRNRDGQYVVFPEPPERVGVDKNKGLQVVSVSPPPGIAITGIEPVSASNKGTVTISIRGFGFTGSPSVRLSKSLPYPPSLPGFARTIYPTSVTRVSENEIQATFNLADPWNRDPDDPAPPGYWDVVVTVVVTVGGNTTTLTTTLYNAFEITCDRISISKLTPSGGDNNAVVTVRIDGSNMFEGVFGELRGFGQVVYPSDVAYPRDDKDRITKSVDMTFDLRGLRPGAWTLRIYNTNYPIPRGSEYAETSFTVNDSGGPYLTGVSPTQNSNLEQDNPFTMRIFGANFDGGTTYWVFLRDPLQPTYQVRSLTSATFVSASELRADFDLWRGGNPVRPGYYDVIVATNMTGTAVVGRLGRAFEVTSPMTIVDYWNDTDFPGGIPNELSIGYLDRQAFTGAPPGTSPDTNTVTIRILSNRTFAPGTTVRLQSAQGTPDNPRGNARVIITPTNVRVSPDGRLIDATFQLDDDNAYAGKYWLTIEKQGSGGRSVVSNVEFRLYYHTPRIVDFYTPPPSPVNPNPRRQRQALFSEIYNGLGVAVEGDDFHSTYVDGDRNRIVTEQPNVGLWLRVWRELAPGYTSSIDDGVVDGFYSHTSWYYTGVSAGSGLPGVVNENECRFVLTYDSVNRTSSPGNHYAFAKHSWAKQVLLIDGDGRDPRDDRGTPLMSSNPIFSVFLDYPNPVGVSPSTMTNTGVDTWQLTVYGKVGWPNYLYDPHMFAPGAEVQLSKVGVPDDPTNIRTVEKPNVSGRTITCIFPPLSDPYKTGKRAEPGYWSIIVRNTDNKWAVLPNALRIVSPPPTITSVVYYTNTKDNNPAQSVWNGPPSQDGETGIIYIYGDNFMPGLTVKFKRNGSYEQGKDPQSQDDIVVVRWNDTAPDGSPRIRNKSELLRVRTRLLVVANFWGKAPGAWDVEVVNDDGQWGNKQRAINVLAKPTIESVKPAQVSNKANYTVTIEGKNFWPGIGVRFKREGFADIAASNIQLDPSSKVQSPSPPTQGGYTKLTCIVPTYGKAPGVWDAVVTNVDGQSSDIVIKGKGGPEDLEITADPPVVTLVSPNKGANSTTSVTVLIKGSNFFPGAKVKLVRRCYTSGQLEERYGTGVNVTSETSIVATFNLQGLEPGSWRVVVENADGKSNVDTDGDGKIDIDYKGAGDEDGDGIDGEDGDSPGSLFYITALAQIVRIDPSSNSNEATFNPFALTIYGSNFWGNESTGLRVALRRAGYPDIEATSESSSPDHSQITCTLNVTGAQLGKWSVVVANPESPEAVLADAFTVTGPPPIVTNITPSEAENNAIRRLTVSGNNFAKGATVKLTRAGFTDIVGANVVVTSSTEIAADFDLVGKAPGLWDVVVINPDGASGSGASLFRLKAPNPVVTAVAPSEASNASDAVNVVIQGDNFFPGCKVYIRQGAYDMPVTNVRVVRKDQISATLAVKDMPAGKWNVYVAAADDDGDPTNGIGDSGTSGVGKFTVIARAVVTSISPTSRLNDNASNPFTLTINGLNLWGDESTGLRVALRRADYPDIEATNESSSQDHMQVTCKLDVTGKAPGYWNLVIKNPESPEVVISNAFVVQAKAVITSVNPSSAPNCDVVTVKVTGSNIWKGCDVRLQKAGEADIVARNVSVKSNSELTCDFDLRMKATGNWNLIITNIQSPPSDPATFTVTQTGNPTVTSIEPNMAPNDTVVDVTVTGSNFMPTDTVKLVPVDISGSDSALLATNVTVVNSRTISCRLNLVGRCPGSWKVVVSGLRNGNKVESTDDVRFTITAKPVVKSVDPDKALNDGTVQVTISGSNFMKGAKVRLKSGDTTVEGTVTSVSREAIVCELNLKGKRPMVMDVEVENTPTQIARLANAFTIQAKAVITNVEPQKGENSSASFKITIVGDNIWRGATCRLKRNGYSDITPIAPPQVEERFVGGENKGSELTCQFDLRGRAPGVWNLVVINPFSPESDPVSWEIVGVYSPDYPEVTGIEPNVGANTGDVLVTIYGRFLYEGARVLLTKGASTIEGQKVSWTQDATKLICTLPLKDKEPGRYDLSIINADGRSVTVQSAFTVTAPATITSISPTTASNTNQAFTLTINGSNFWDGAKVKLRRAGFADIEAVSVNVASRTQINCVFNLKDTDNNAGNGLQSASPGKWAVVVQNVPHDAPPMSPEAIYADALTITAPSPQVTGINPSEGERDSIVSVTIVGSNFFSGASVALRKLGQAPIVAGNVQVVDNSTIKCSFDLTGAALGGWSVVVTNSDGQSGMLANAFLVKGKQPKITKVTPNQALKGTIVGVTIDGENFYSGITVELKKDNTTIPGTSTTLLNDRQVWTRFDLRNVVANGYDLVVRNADGQSATLQNGFTVYEVPNINPEVSSVSPNSGDNDKDELTVTVSGRYFFPNATVKLVKAGQPDIIGSVIKMNDKDGDVTNGNEEIECKFNLKGKAAGKWDLTVVNINGLASANTPNDDFTVKALAVVTGVVPSSALNTAPVTVTITGSNFWAGATVKLRHKDGGEVTGSNVVVADRTRIVCTFDIRGKLPAPWDVVVKNEGSEEGVKERAFVVTAMSPVVTSVSPSEAINNAVATLTIDGNYFYRPTVKLARSGQPEIEATNINVFDRDGNLHGDRITCKVDLRGALIGRWDVVVTNYDGKSTRLSGVLLVKSASPPTVSTITPNRATNYGSINVTITGTNFYSGAVVRIEKDNGTSKKVVNATNVVVKSATQITATINVHNIETGNWDVVVVNPDGQSGTLKGGLEIVKQGPPQISRVSPQSAPNTGQVVVEITGSMLLSGAMVRLTKDGQADILALSVKYTFISFDEQKLTCVFDLRDRAPGSWNVVVRNPDGKEGKLDNAFTITANRPVVTAISPTYTAPNTGIVTLTIIGTNFFSGAQAFLRLGTNDIRGTVTSLSKTSLTSQFDLKGAQPGKWSVVVRNTDEKEGVKAEAFIVTAPATLSKIEPTGGENTAQVTVTIYGSNFWEGATVVLRREGQPDISATNVQVSQDHKQITCTFDLRGVTPGRRAVIVTNPYTSPAWSSNVTFMVYAPAPVINSVSPSEGLNNAPLTVKLIGDNFYPGMLVMLRKVGQPDINATNVVVKSRNEATCTLGLVGKAPGKWSLQAVNADGRIGVSVFIIKAQAVISAVTPSQGSNLQSKNPITVTISGSNFWSGAKVLLRKSGQRDIEATNVVVESSSRIKATFDLTNAATGKWDVVVINVSDGVESPPGVRTEIFNIVAQ